MFMSFRFQVNAALILTIACSAPPHDDYVDPVPAPRYTPFDLYRGHYQSGFEVSAFQPCGSTELWWLEPGEPQPWYELERRANRALDDNFAMARGAGVYIEFRGDTSSSGRYGHMGGYEREVTLRSIEIVRRMRPSDCADARSSSSYLWRPPQN